MPIWAIFSLFFFIVVIAHFLEGVTGFGSTALSMPFLTILLGIHIAKPVLALYTLLLCIYILARSIKNVDWRTFGKMMAAMIIGLPIGIFLYNQLPKKPLLILLSVFMIVVSVRGLLYNFGILKQGKKPKEILSLILVFLGGIMHGAFASGGPLIIIYATGKIPEKSRFRATMCMVWLTLNTVLLAQMAFSNQLTQEVGSTSLWGLPFLIGGTLLGDWAHKHIKDTFFTKLTFGILLASGIFMAISNI